MINRNKKLNNGYTLLFAVLVSSVVLAIGISILTISKKEFLLASSARESTYAFYAADSGRECAIYNDNGTNFSTSSPQDTSPICASQIANMPYVPSGQEGTFTFHVKLNNNACAIVTVRQYYDNSEPTTLGNIPRTTIESRGYNMGWSGTACNQANARRVERALRLTY